MSDQIVRTALARMHQRDVALAPVYTGFMADMQMLATADPQREDAAYRARLGDLCAAYGMSPTTQSKPFAFSDGLAIIPVHGTLINRFSNSWGYVTGYNFVRQMTALAGQDPDVTHIVYDHNSYGGEAAGCFECAADIPVLANGKPTIACIDSNCYSASYALASTCDYIICTPSGGAGSVGVITMHVDMSQALEKWGFKVTMLYAGEHKADGNPYEPLPDALKTEILASLETSRQAFAELVATGRKMDVKDVLKTEARIYKAADAKSVGFIDAVATPTEGLRAYLSGSTGSRSTSKGNTSMSTQNEPGGTSNAAAEQKAAADARTAERARIQGILGSEEAKGREALANHLAMNTEMSVDQAKGILAASPKVEPKAEPAANPAPAAAGANPFKAAMDATKNPNVGADAGSDAGQSEEPAHLRILRAQEAATGFKPKQAA